MSRVLESQPGPRAAPIVHQYTVVVEPGETVRVAVPFEGFTEPYVFLCHDLQHGDHGMMRQFRVRPRN